MGSIRIALDPDSVKQLQEYHSWIERKPDTPLLRSIFLTQNLTDYWDTQTGNIKIEFEKNFISLAGSSGFYFPQPATKYKQLRHYIGQSLANLSHEPLTTYTKAYESMCKQNPPWHRHPSQKKMSWEKPQNIILDFKTVQGMKKKMARI